MRYIWIFILLFISCKVDAFPPATHGLIHSTASSTPTLSANIISKMFHWQSAKDMPALSDGTAITITLKIVNFGQDSNLSDPNAYSNTTYFSDGVHPTTTGLKLVAKYVAEVIRLFNW